MQTELKKEEIMISEEPNNSVADEQGSIKRKKATKSGLPRKEFEWTPKRKEAFDKMRKGLEDKVLITKQIKEEKKKSEKEAIKSRVREIMQSKKGPLPDFSESDKSSDEDEPPVEAPAPKKKKFAPRTEVSAPPAAQAPIRHKKRKEVVPVVEEESESEYSSDESEAEQVRPARSQVQYTPTQHRNYQRDKAERGKAIKVAQFVNPLDRFILL